MFVDSCRFLQAADELLPARCGFFGSTRGLPVLTSHLTYGRDFHLF